jgi:MULE transposase domain
VELDNRNATHNHQMPRSVGQIPGFRRDDRSEVVLQDIEDLSRQPALTAADIVDQIQATYDIRMLPKDVANHQQKIKEVMFEGRTAFQQFIHELEADPNTSKSIGRQDDNPAAKIDRVFWTYRRNIDLWKANWVVVSIDNTYKVNRYNMPLCQINRITALHTTFPVAYCLVSGEREEVFSWVLGQLKDLAAADGIPDPLVIISDFDKAFKRAARSEYGSSQHQICLWHVMKNVAYNVKKKWNGPLEGSVLVATGNGTGNNIRDDEVEDVGEPSVSRDSGDDFARADNSRMAVNAASRLLEPSDRSIHLGSSVRNANTTVFQAQSTGSSRKYVDNPDGILLAWKAVVYAETEDNFWAAWRLLKAEFPEQPGRLTLLFSLRELTG